MSFWDIAKDVASAPMGLPGILAANALTSGGGGNSVPQPANLGTPLPDMYSPNPMSNANPSNFTNISNNLMNGSAIKAPGLGSGAVGSAPIIGYQQGLTPQNINQALSMTQGVYNTAGALGSQFMQNSRNAANPNYNPAIGAFNNATMANSMGVSSALASQRGSAINPGLAARNIGQAGVTAQQQSVGQLGSLIDQYAMGQQQNAMGAYGLQGNMANAYGQIGLQNQGQILSAIANQNQAQVAMQSNVNTSNVAMQSNINNNATQQYLGQLGSATNMFDSSLQSQTSQNNANLAYNSSIYGTQSNYNANTYNSYLQYLTAQNGQNNAMWGGVMNGVGSAAAMLPFLLAGSKGGEVSQGQIRPPQGYARGGQVRGYARGGQVRGYANGGETTGNFDLGADPSMPPPDLQGLQQSVTAPLRGMDSSGPDSMIGKMLKQMQGQQDSAGQDPSSQMKNAAWSQLGQQGPPWSGAGKAAGVGLMALFGMLGGKPKTPMSDAATQMPGMGAQFNQPPQGFGLGVNTQMPQMAQGGIAGAPNPMGPSMPNLALAGSPNPHVAMPPTGLPMGNSETRGGGMMPAPGSSGHMARGGVVQMHPSQYRRMR